MIDLAMSVLDKSEWGEGPWQHEPDRLEWHDPATKLPCMIIRSSAVGSLCGYVGVPPWHPYHGKHYDACEVEVHGGLTYSERCNGDICHIPGPGESDDIWWLGFDCGHAADLSPLLSLRLKLAGYGKYRTVAYVKAACADLARQLVGKSL